MCQLHAVPLNTHGIVPAACSTAEHARFCLLQDFATLPWELDMPHDKAAAILGSYLGVPNLEPASVLDLDVHQITGDHGSTVLAYAC